MLMLKYKRLSVLFIVFSVVYIAAALFSNPDKATLAKYHITADQAVALGLTIAVPYLIIWFIALIGYLRFKDYTYAISDDKDGAALALICRGILLLTLWLPISTVSNALASHYYHDHHSATANLVRLDNYLNVVILFFAFLIINQGAAKLLPLVKKTSYQIPQRIIILFISLAALYVFMTLNDPARQLPTKTVAVATYYLPDWATVVTVIIPRLIMWFLGIQAIYFVYLYKQKIKGTLYKSALHKLAWGLGWVVASIIVLRCFQSLSTQLARLNLGLLLLIVYALLFLISRGYVLIAKGARDLQKIEEI